MFAAILPGLVGVFLRVYENTLVRQTESELIAQTAALSATAEALWPGAVMVAATPEQRLRARLVPAGGRDHRSGFDAGPAGPARGAAGAAARSGGGRPERPAAADHRRDGPHDPGLDHPAGWRGVVVDGYARAASWGDLPEVRSALAGRPYTVLRRNADYHPRYSMEWLSRPRACVSITPDPSSWTGQVRGVILTSRSPRALFKGIYQDRIKIAFGILGTLSVIAVLAMLVARGIARPIEKLSEAAREVTTGRRDPAARAGHGGGGDPHPVRGLQPDGRGGGPPLPLSARLRRRRQPRVQDAAGGDPGRGRTAAGPRRDHGDGRSANASSTTSPPMRGGWRGW
jgi:two-component system sensor histidine kinase ChvG